MDKIIISIHSMVDLITNSSTELFVLDTDKSLQVVKDLLKDKEKEFPPEYGHYISVDYCQDSELNEAFGYVDVEESINYLRAKGYKIEEPNNNINNSYFSVSAERGGLDPRLKEFIETNFTVIHYTTEA